MTALYIISFILLVVATIALLKLTPEQINKDINELFNKQQTLKDQALTARGKKKKNRILLELERMRRALQETGKDKQFSIQESNQDDRGKEKEDRVRIAPTRRLYRKDDEAPKGSDLCP